MITEIYNDGASLKYLEGRFYNIFKQSIENIWVEGNLVKIRTDRTIYDFDYTKITTPVAASADALRILIEGYCDSDLEVAIGDPDDAEASSDTGTFSLIAFFKRLLTKITTLNAKDFATESTLGNIEGKLGSPTETPPATDTASSAVNGRLQRIAQNISTTNGKTATDVHQRIHSANYWNFGDNVNLGSGGVRDILIITGATKKAHIYATVQAFNVSSNKTISVDVYEGTTVSANGTGLTIFANNRGNILVPELTAFHTPTVTTTGTAIMPTRIGKDEMQLFSTRPGEEYDFNSNTKYLIRITSLIANNDVRFNSGFYEV